MPLYNNFVLLGGFTSGIISGITSDIVVGYNISKFYRSPLFDLRSQKSLNEEFLYNPKIDPEKSKNTPMNELLCSSD